LGILATAVLAKYVIAQRAKLGGQDRFSFTFFDNSVDFNASGFVPKWDVSFFSKIAAQSAARKSRFLEPASPLFKELPAEKH